MAEWYDVGADYERGQQLLSDLLVRLLDCEPAESVSFEQAFQAAIGLPLFESSPADFGRWAVENEIVDTEKWSTDWDDWVNLLFSERVQGMLGWHRPAIVKDFPASQAALAVVSENDPRTAERYEIFYHGVELANGYHELLDAKVLADRDRLANQQRVLDGKTVLPTCEKLIEAMRNGIPASCGCALGFDRVVMLACNATSLREVVSFAAERA
jgi:lysyl-tRNA synthetase class 2